MNRVFQKQGKHRKHWWTRIDRRASSMIVRYAVEYFSDMLVLRAAY